MEHYKEYKTYSDALLSFVDGRRSGEAGTIRFVSGRRADTQSRSFSVANLVERSIQVASNLKDFGVKPGDVVMIAQPTNENFVIAFNAAVLLGALPCPIPDEGTLNAEAHPFSHHVRAAISRFKPVALITTSDICRHLLGLDPVLSAIAVTVEALQKPASPSFIPYEAKPSDLLQIQLTSGSTSAPKAAALSHGAVVSNIVLTARRGDADLSNHRGMIWLPLFHDMGLISVMSAIYHNCDLVLQPPEDFIINPMSWLSNMSAYQCTSTAAPNFALAYCVRRFRADLLENVDLSCIHTMVIGAEKVHLSTLRAFAAKFSPFGFNSDAFYPCYGTAELTLAVTVPSNQKSAGLGAHVRWDEQCVRMPGGNVVPSDMERESQEWLISLGEPLEGSVLQIRDQDGRILKDREVGEVFVSSPCMMSGYFQDEQETNRVLKDGFYSTGDYGYLNRGELYLVGRIKELIILRGRNYPPHEFEECATSSGQVDIGRVAAFGLADAEDGSEKLVIAVEPENYLELDELRLTIQQRLRKRFGFGASEICFIKKGGLPRTTSRKIRRVECARLFASGMLPIYTENYINS